MPEETEHRPAPASHVQPRGRVEFNYMACHAPAASEHEARLRTLVSAQRLPQLRPERDRVQHRPGVQHQPAEPGGMTGDRISLVLADPGRDAHDAERRPAIGVAAHGGVEGLAEGHRLAVELEGHRLWDAVGRES